MLALDVPLRQGQRHCLSPKWVFSGGRRVPMARPDALIALVETSTTGGNIVKERSFVFFDVFLFSGNISYG